MAAAPSPRDDARFHLGAVLGYDKVLRAKGMDAAALRKAFFGAPWPEGTRPRFNLHAKEVIDPPPNVKAHHQHLEVPPSDKPMFYRSITVFPVVQGGKPADGWQWKDYVMTWEHVALGWRDADEENEERAAGPVAVTFHECFDTDHNGCYQAGRHRYIEIQHVTPLTLTELWTQWGPQAFQLLQNEDCLTWDAALLGLKNKQ